MRNCFAIMGTFASTAAFAHSGHGELSALHHKLLSPLNSFETIAIVVGAAVLFAYAAWKRS